MDRKIALDIPRLCADVLDPEAIFGDDEDDDDDGARDLYWDAWDLFAGSNPTGDVSGPQHLEFSLPVPGLGTWGGAAGPRLRGGLATPKVHFVPERALKSISLPPVPPPQPPQ